MTDREVMQQALEALESGPDVDPIFAGETITALRKVLEQPEQEPVAWTERELKLIDGMIGVQLDHANRCDSIANRTMADKQKGWDMERVALLQKIKATPPAAQRKPLTDDKVREVYQPIGWLDDLDDNAEFMSAALRKKHEAKNSSTPDAYTIPVYTTPPAAQRPWVGLTEEEVNTLWGEWKDAVCLDYKTWAQAIEAKLKERNT